MCGKICPRTVKQLFGCIQKGDNIVRYFFVFQNKTFYREKDGGYLWAPDGNCSHWKLMREISQGDIIFHSYHRHIVAVSKAASNCYFANQPNELAVEHLWQKDGLKVDSTYCLLPVPLDTKNVMSALLDLQPTKYAPFNIRGRGNTGYLFNNSPEMAAFLLTELKQSSQNRQALLSLGL